MSAIKIRNDDGDLESVENVADVAEVMPGRLQVVYEDESDEFVPGSLFCGYGRWKIWLNPRDGEIEKYIGEDPMTMPGEFIRFHEGDVPTDRAATIKRLKRADL